jgi:hypothetical protein
MNSHTTLFEVDVAVPRGYAAEKARVGYNKSNVMSENATHLKLLLGGKRWISTGSSYE